MTTRAGFILELRDIGGDVPVECRLRHVLKRLLRDHHFRCTSIRMAGAAQTVETPHQTAQDGEQGQGMSKDTTSAADAPELQLLETNPRRHVANGITTTAGSDRQRI